MLDIILKSEVFDLIEQGLCKEIMGSLKDFQDAFILSILKNFSKKRILEMGGGGSRTLPVLNKKNECWNVDKLEGLGHGPIGPIAPLKNVKLVKSYLGEFSNEIPDDYFDVVYSISVVEHIQKEQIKDTFLDIKRVLKKNGESYHVIDFFVGDENSYIIRETIQDISYMTNFFLSTIQEAGLSLIDKKIMDIKTIKFKPTYATLNDSTLHKWLTIQPSNTSLRRYAESNQVVSLKLGFRKM